MAIVSDQVQYESRTRSRWAIVAFVAAIGLVLSQLLELSGPQPPVSEATVTLITENARATIDLIGSAVDMIGLLAMSALVYWLHRISQAREPTLRTATRWTASGGAAIAAVMAMVYTVLFTIKAHQFVTTGNQGYPEAAHLFSSAIWFVPQLVLELGDLLMAVGVVLVVLSVMRVGLIPRTIGYAGVVAGALFIIGVPLLTPIVQGFWLAATAVLLYRRWPSGDPPAWESGTAVPWAPVQRGPDQRGTKAQRRRRVSDSEVFAAVESHETPPNPHAGRAKRKRRK